MNLQTNGDYNPVQLNETLNFDPNGKVLSKSLMINIRNEDPKIVWRLYRELKELIDQKDNSPAKIEKIEVLDNSNEKRCPICGGLMIEKSGISKKSKKPYHFFSCQNFPNCKYSEPFIETKDSTPEEPMDIEY